VCVVMVFPKHWGSGYCPNPGVMESVRSEIGLGLLYDAHRCTTK
jgi:hypothetical protein